jgi:glucose-6-phosphate isomerase
MHAGASHFFVVCVHHGFRCFNFADTFNASSAFETSLKFAGLDQEETLVVVVSKTFTTAETMLNARTVRAWLTAKLGKESVSKHMVAVSTNKKLVKQFGIDTNNMFGFWDWVGGRYSVCSAVGVLPLALQYGFTQCELFLEGAHSMDEHFRTAPFAQNLPVMMGLLSVWNSTFLGYSSRAILPYCQALSKLPPHIQQVRHFLRMMPFAE